MQRTISAFAIGALFGLGLTVSQMINPTKVLGFLDLFGAWDPSLALVMAGALIVTGIGYRLVLRQPAPLLAKSFRLPTARDLDRRLLAGAAVFGLGWGLAGFCPGPAISALASGRWQTFAFIVAMVCGFWVSRLADRRQPA